MRLSRTVTKLSRIGITVAMLDTGSRVISGSHRFLGSSKSLATMFLHVFVESLIGLDAVLLSKLLLKKFWVTWFLREC